MKTKQYRVVGELTYLDEERWEEDETKTLDIDETVTIEPNEREDDEDQALRLAIDEAWFLLDEDKPLHYEFNGRYIDLEAQRARQDELALLDAWNSGAPISG